MKPGDKVVCVGDKPCRICGAPSGLRLNAVYVVQEINPFVDRKGLFGVRVIGVNTRHERNCLISYYPQLARFFGNRRFRLLDEMKKEATQRQEQNL